MATSEEKEYWKKVQDARNSIRWRRIKSNTESIIQSQDGRFKISIPKKMNDRARSQLGQLAGHAYNIMGKSRKYTLTDRNQEVFQFISFARAKMEIGIILTHENEPKYDELEFSKRWILHQNK